MKTENWLDLFKRYEWAKLHIALSNSIFINDKDCPAYVCLKAITLSSYWGEKEFAINFINESKVKASYKYLINQYIKLDGGEDVKVNKEELSDDHLSMFLLEWISIERVVRGRDFPRLLEIIKKMNKPLENWVYSAILNGLGHDNLKSTDYLEAFTEQIRITKGSDYLRQLVLLRIKGGVNPNRNLSLQYRDLINKTNNSNLAKQELAILLIKNGEIKEAIDIYIDILKDEPLSKKHMYELLSAYISFPHRQNEFIEHINNCQKLLPDSLATKGGVATYSIIYHWINQNYDSLLEIAIKNIDFKNVNLPKSERSLLTFYNYIALLGQSFAKNQHRYKENYTRELLVLGESHSLCLNGLIVNIGESKYRCKSKFIMGVKMHHIANIAHDQRTRSLKEHLLNVKNDSDLMFCIGEIDTRPDEGIWKASKKNGQPVKVIIANMVRKYINALTEMIPLRHNGMVIIQGIPAPCYDPRSIIGDDNLDRFLDMFLSINDNLKQETLKQGWSFLDVYSATVSVTGFTNKKFHIDPIHLKPDIYLSFNEFLINDTKKNKQFSITNQDEIGDDAMSIIRINDKEYELDKLNHEAKSQLASMQFCDQELQRLQAQAAAIQTARMAYAKALSEALNPSAKMDGKISFN